MISGWGYMQANPKFEVRNPKGDTAEDGLVTRPGLATALQVSVCTVDRMADNGEIPRVRVRRRVRFYLADVMEALRKGGRKFGRAAELTAEAAKSAERSGRNGQEQIANGQSQIPDSRFQSREKAQRTERRHLTQPSSQSGEGAAVTRRNGGAA